jgi:hypothetical protein
MNFFGVKIHVSAVLENILAMAGVVALFFGIYVLTGHNFLGYKKGE